jgi:hypothetical protein
MMSEYHIHKSFNHWFEKFNPNTVFYCSLSAFFIDGVIHKFTKLPFFTGYLALLTPFLLLSIYKKRGHLPYISIFFLVSICFSSLMHIFKYGVHLKNLSDTLYIAVFAISFTFYHIHSDKLKVMAVWILSAVLGVMFMFSFVKEGTKLIVNKAEQVQVLELLDDGKPRNKSGYTIGGAVEKNRQYHAGLFKVAHVGAFLLGICLLGFWLLPVHQNKLAMLLVSVIILFLIVWSGTRIFFAALLPGLIIYLLRKKQIMYIVGGVVLLVIITYFRLEIYEATRHTPLGSISGVFIAVLDDWQNLSRIAIWKVWLAEVKSFTWFELFFGKGYAQSFEVTGAVFEKPIWFHNDSLSIIFSYGLLTFLLYILMIADWIKQLLHELKNNLGLLVLFITLLTASLLNGLYFYQPLFFFYIFFLILNTPKKAIV